MVATNGTLHVPARDKAEPQATLRIVPDFWPVLSRERRADVCNERSPRFLVLSRIILYEPFGMGTEM
jgi:hypothetical protein